MYITISVLPDVVSTLSILLNSHLNRYPVMLLSELITLILVVDLLSNSKKEVKIT
jgi:hypothetical protein